jgi:hypothetical protein
MRGRSVAAGLADGAEPTGREDVFAYGEPGYAMLRTEDWKYIQYAGQGEALFDLLEEPGEVENHVNDEGAQEILEEMRHRMLVRSLGACRSPLRRLTCW